MIPVHTEVEEALQTRLHIVIWGVLKHCDVWDPLPKILISLGWGVSQAPSKLPRWFKGAGKVGKACPSESGWCWCSGFHTQMHSVRSGAEMSQTGWGQCMWTHGMKGGGCRGWRTVARMTETSGYWAATDCPRACMHTHPRTRSPNFSRNAKNTAVSLMPSDFKMLAPFFFKIQCGLNRKLDVAQDLLVCNVCPARVTNCFSLSGTVLALALKVLYLGPIRI